jgi:two-component system sensor histidine kinase YesM
VQTTPRQIVFGESRTIGRFTGLTVAFILALCVVFAKWFSSRVVSPITDLTKLIGEVERNNYRITADVRGNDEIADLAGQFNRMVKQINTLFHTVYLARLHERETELRALQAQVNPHFLYNALSTIYLQARQEGNHKSSRLIKDLSDLFRFSMRNDQPFVPLSEEIHHLKAYVSFQQERLGERLEFRLFLPADGERSEVLRLSLQPIVENAIEHGMEELERIGRVSVEIVENDTAITYIVTDNGVGIERRALLRLRESLARRPDNDRDGVPSPAESPNGIGLHNLAERLRLYYGPSARLEIESERGTGTTVTVKQPKTRQRENSTEDG